MFFGTVEFVKPNNQTHPRRKHWQLLFWILFLFAMLVLVGVKCWYWITLYLNLK